MKQKIYVFRLICFVLCGFILLFMSNPLFAQEKISLEQAIDSDLVRIEIHGRDVAFIQPMLEMTLENLSDSPLIISIGPGLVLASSDPYYADMIISKAASISLPSENSESINARLFAYSLDLNKSFPSTDIEYTVDQISSDNQLMVLLNRIMDAEVESDLSGQLAVWMLVGNVSTFDDLDGQIEESLEIYRQQTESLLTEPTSNALIDFLQGFFLTLIAVLPLVSVGLYIRSRFLGSSPYLLGTYPYMIKDDVSAIGATEYMWKAQHVWNKKFVALKFPISIDGVFVELFGPGEKNYQLEHDDNIILSMESRRTFQEKSKDNRIYIILENITGCSLAELLLSHKAPFSVPMALEIIEQLLGSLKYIHDDEQGIIELRDVQPNNILIDRDGTVFIVNFGSTLTAAKGKDLKKKNNVEMYLAPEARGNQSVPRIPADIYSMGVVLYELLTGKLPFDKKNDSRRKLARNFEKEIESKVLQEVITTCLKTNPQERYQSVDEIRFALEEHDHYQEELAKVVQDYCAKQKDNWWQVLLSS